MQNSIKQLINRHGPLTVDQLISHVLVDHDASYYQQDGKIGHKGDFITAPEISQLFSEMLAIWVRLCWEKLGSKECLLVELGPGRGKLIEAIIRFNIQHPNFKGCVKVALVERSMHLRKIQKEILEPFDIQINWYDNFSDIATQDVPMILVANEFCDALPIKQFEKKNNGWYERVLITRDDQFEWSAIKDKAEHALPNASTGAIYEQMEVGVQLVSALSQYISSHGGAAIIIDYGYDLAERCDDNLLSSLQAIRNHKYEDVLTSLGEADLSCHVDFAQLKAAIDKELHVIGVIEQQSLLKALGIEFRLQQLLRAAQHPAIYQTLIRQYHRLMSAAQMGQLYKALLFSSFDSQDLLMQAE